MKNQCGVQTCSELQRDSVEAKVIVVQAVCNLYQMPCGPQLRGTADALQNLDNE